VKLSDFGLSLAGSGVAGQTPFTSYLFDVLAGSTLYNIPLLSTTVRLVMTLQGQLALCEVSSAKNLTVPYRSWLCRSSAPPFLYK